MTALPFFVILDIFNRGSRFVSSNTFGYQINITLRLHYFLNKWCPTVSFPVKETVQK